MSDSNAASQNLESVLQRIKAASRSVRRDPAGVTLIAVSKTHDAARIAPLIAAGQRDFGENRVQEAFAKWPGLKEQTSGIHLHLIGPLQSNKAGDAVGLFDVIHSVDRLRIAEALASEMERQGRRPSCFIQVNTGREPQKAGIDPGEADAFIALCRERLKLPIAGRNKLTGLSMGMSADFETAVRFGATHVRVGTALFGAREA